MAMPGDNLEVLISFCFGNKLISFPKKCCPVQVDVELIYPTAMQEGMTFTIREGGRTVGAGRITKVA